MITISINFVDGSFSEWQENENIINEYYRLIKMGYKGKSLVNTLISDDWGAPPLFVSLKGELGKNGQKISESISYE